MFGSWLYLSVCVIATAYTVWARDLKFGHSTLLVTLKKSFFFFWNFDFFSRVMPLFRFSPLATVLISIIYWWISKINSSKESCCEVEYETYDKIYMWRISIVFFCCIFWFCILWTFKTWYLFAIYISLIIIYSTIH